MSSWTITRGVKTNRVRGAKRRKLGPDARHDRSPQRAKRRRSNAEGQLWTQICISVPVDDLFEIDALAEREGVSRSNLLVECALSKSRETK